jgi:NAD+ synthase
MPLSRAVLDLDVDAEIAEIAASIRSTVARLLHRRGAVIAVSGGIDSAACAALCAQALGSQHVVALLMPERDSSPEALILGRQLAASLDVRCVDVDIAPALDALGCFDRQGEAIRTVFPQFGPGWRFKVALPSILDRDRFNLTRPDRRGSDGRTARGTAGGWGVPAARGGHQLQATSADGDGLLPRRRLALRGMWDTEPPRVRPGLLRQGR